MSNRRDFLKTTAAVGAVVASSASLYAAGGGDTIKVGLIGCGGRGRGAVRDILNAEKKINGDNPKVEIVAVADAFEDRAKDAVKAFTNAKSQDYGSFVKQVKITPETTFVGLDAYQKLLATDVNLVILATPPGFRPTHLEAAVKAKKHIFCEKPVAVDATGARKCYGLIEESKKANIAIVAGTQRRHQAEYLEVIQRLHDSAIGDVVSGQVFWNQGGLWNHARQPNWSDTEWQIRNWLYFAWLSGDHIVEQHVHNIDVANWVMRGHPVRAIGVGGRQQRTDPRYGHIYDHFGIDFEYENGARVLSMCRQIDGTQNRIGENFIGASGRAEFTSQGSRILGGKAYTYSRPEKPVNPYVQEHTDLVASIRAGKPLNELKQVAESTLTAIMGREAAYTGQELTWDQVLNAELDLKPPHLAFGPLEVPPVPVPGVTRLNRKWNEGGKPATKG